MTVFDKPCFLYSLDSSFRIWRVWLSFVFRFGALPNAVLVLGGTDWWLVAFFLSNQLLRFPEVLIR